MWNSRAYAGTTPNCCCNRGGAVVLAGRDKDALGLKRAQQVSPCELFHARAAGFHRRRIERAPDDQRVELVSYVHDDAGTRAAREARGRVIAAVRCGGPALARAWPPVRPPKSRRKSGVVLADRRRVQPSATLVDSKSRREEIDQGLHRRVIEDQRGRQGDREAAVQAVAQLDGHQRIDADVEQTMMSLFILLHSFIQ